MPSASPAGNIAWGSEYGKAQRMIPAAVSLTGEWSARNERSAGMQANRREQGAASGVPVDCRNSCSYVEQMTEIIAEQAVEQDFVRLPRR